MLNQRQASCLLIVFFSIFVTFACANYPNEPRDPKINDDTYTLEEDSMLAVSAENGILANDIPQEGEENYLIEVNGQKAVEGEAFIINLDGGRVFLELDGSFTYEPEKDFNGMDQLSYKIKNDKGKEGTGTTFFQVMPLNDAPVAADDQFSISPTPQQSLDVLANDDDPDGDSIRISNVDILENGSARVADGGMTILFTPDADHTGDVNFSYTILDESGEKDQAWVLLTNGDGENNLVRPDAMTVMEDHSETQPFSWLLANDHVDPDSEIEFGPAQNGDVHANDDRTFTYTPNANFTGTDYFTYTVATQGGIRASATVTVTVTPVADAPIIDDIPNQRVDIGQTLGPVIFSVSNVDTSQTRLSVTASVSDAVPPQLISEDDISILGSSGSRAMWITPAPDQAGTATITITVSNGQTEASDSFQLTVGTVGRAPEITLDGEFDPVIAANTSLTVHFTIQDADTPINTLRVSAISENPAVVPNDDSHLALSGGNNRDGRRSITITPADGQTGNATVVLSVSDGEFIGDQRFSLEVIPEDNLPPVFLPIQSMTFGVDETVDIPLDIIDETPAADLHFDIEIDADDSDIIIDENVSFPYDELDDYRSLRILPPFLEGTATITLTVRDSLGEEAQIVFDLTFI